MRRVLLHGAGTARWWDEYAVIRVPPDTRIGRKIGRCALSYRRKAQAADQVSCAGENTSGDVSCTSGHRLLLCDTGEPISKNKLYQYWTRFRARRGKSYCRWSGGTSGAGVV